MLAPGTPLTWKPPTQGLVEAWNFNQIEAQRAFSAALVADPACSRCWWGMAYALGPGANRYAQEPRQHLSSQRCSRRRNQSGRVKAQGMRSCWQTHQNLLPQLMSKVVRR